MKKWAERIGGIIVGVGMGAALLALLVCGTVAVHDAVNEDWDSETYFLAQEMSHDLRYLADYCAFSNNPPETSAYQTCSDRYGELKAACGGTVAPQLEGFCEDWEVITYIKVNGTLMATSMIRLAQDIERWTEGQ